MSRGGWAVQLGGGLVGFALGAGAGLVVAKAHNVASAWWWSQGRPESAWGALRNTLPAALLACGGLLGWLILRATGWRGAAWGVAAAFAAWLVFISVERRIW